MDARTRDLVRASPPIGVYRTRVEWVDTDASGLYHNSSVIRFVEAAEARLMEAHGDDGFTRSAPRARYEVDFEAPLVFGQGVEATVHLEHLGTSSMRFSFEVWGEAHSGRPRVRAAVGRYVAVHVDSPCDPGSLRALPWPPAWVDALEGEIRQTQGT